MREKELISIIKTISGSQYIGDDCAFLKDLGIVITQDNLIEDVHFSLEYCSFYELGYKSVMVNLSDICASGAKPKYITIGLSIPKNVNNQFVEDFYVGCKKACGNDIEIIGGDLTSSEKIMISVCAIGITKDRKISSRQNAKIGQKVVVSGVHGSSSAGLYLLKNNIKKPQQLIKSHLLPQAQINFSKNISTRIDEDYAMMDTSDGLMDALTTISEDSKVCLEIDFEKIPIDSEIQTVNNWSDYVLYGGEDYQLVATVPKDLDVGIPIGYVTEGCGVNLKIKNKKYFYTRKNIENKLYNHFIGAEE